MDIGRKPCKRSNAVNDPVLLVTDPDPRIAMLTLNRPAKRNALSLELIEQITQATRAAGADADKRVIIFAGNGPVFCAGLDLHEAAARQDDNSVAESASQSAGISSSDKESRAPGASPPAGASRSAEALAAMYLAIATSPLITIAAAQGAAMGGGAGILAACDFAIAADDLRIAYPEVRRGLVAALVSCLLRRQLNDADARELVLLGQPIPANRAREMGLIRQVTPAAHLQNAALELARQSSQGAPGAIARSKRLLDALAPRLLAEDLARALAFHREARESAEAAEGMRAFLEKREPHWPPRQIERPP